MACPPLLNMRHLNEPKLPKDSFAITDGFHACKLINIGVVGWHVPAPTPCSFARASGKKSW